MKRVKVPMWVWAAAAVVAVAMLVQFTRPGGAAMMGCPKSQVYCPGVGCLSGMDKCLPGSRGGASAVFSKEGFTSSPPPGVTKTCPGKVRSDGPCLMQF